MLSFGILSVICYHDQFNLDGFCRNYQSQNTTLLRQDLLAKTTSHWIFFVEYIMDIDIIVCSKDSCTCTIYGHGDHPGEPLVASRHPQPVSKQTSRQQG